MKNGFVKTVPVNSRDLQFRPMQKSLVSLICRYDEPLMKPPIQTQGTFPSHIPAYSLMLHCYASFPSCLRGVSLFKISLRSKQHWRRELEGGRGRREKTHLSPSLIWILHFPGAYCTCGTHLGAAEGVADQ